MDSKVKTAIATGAMLCSMLLQGCGDSSEPPTPTSTPLITAEPAVTTSSTYASQPATAESEGDATAPSQPTMESREIKANEDTGSVLRDRALSVSAADIGIEETERVWGVIMDSGLGEDRWFTVVTFLDGTASLYLSTGGGVIGGAFHENVRDSVAKAIEVADEMSDLARLSTPGIPPAGSSVRFYLKKDDQLLATADIAESDLAERISPMAPLFWAMQDVIAQLRMIAQ